jgi:tRNA(Ile)-lysidine synthase TilS/MesJ
LELGKSIQKRMVKAMATYRLIDDGDHILIGLSGGKDSLCLLEMLSIRQRISHPSFQLTALHVRMDNVSYETDTTFLQQFCDRHSVPLRIVNTRFDAPSEGQKEKPACFLCSWMRRKQLFNIAQEIGCNKIALGHHQDDLIHTALMNLFYQGHFSTISPLMVMRKMPLAVIRPLCLVAERDIKDYALQQGWPEQLKHCPYEHETQRTAMRRLFENVEKMNSEARYSVWNALFAEKQGTTEAGKDK